MLKLDLQLFASKKGVGSTKNGRDSESKRLGAKLSDGQTCTAGSIIYRLVLMLVKVETILYSLKLMVSLNTKDLVKTRNRYLFTL